MLREVPFWSPVPGKAHPKCISGEYHVKGNTFIRDVKMNTVPIREFSQVWFRNSKQKNFMSRQTEKCGTFT